MFKLGIPGISGSWLDKDVGKAPGRRNTTCKDPERKEGLITLGRHLRSLCGC